MNPTEFQNTLDRLCASDADVVFFPVRHHSPTCASLIAQCIADCKPAAVLIEGPSDFNAHLDELLLEHELPIAIYSYFRSREATCGAYYPFCEYSPEWSALQHARQAGAIVRFIDLPWSDVARHDRTAHRYADAKLRRGRYVQSLCDRMQVEDFDDLWDKLIESQPQLSLGDYLQRVHSLCFHIRLWEEDVSVADRLREAFMAEQIQRMRDDTHGRMLVVTGGFHSSALAARLEGLACPGIDTPESPADDQEHPIEESGIALTTYSYERLDNLTGYNAGMPSPGFYEHTWRQRASGSDFSHVPLLASLVHELRDRRQTLSTADLIAVETSARALAALRGRSHVWRRDLIDAVTTSLIKDELEYGCESPFVDAVHAVLRGRRRGKLAEGTRMPPLVTDIRRQLAEAELEMTRGIRNIELNLLEPADLAKSRLLHRLRVLGIVGYQRTDGTDFLARDDLRRLWESWRVRWSPEFEATCIEASRYGTSLADAANACLLEEAREHDRDAATAAKLLVQAAQAGIETMSSTLLDQLQVLIHEEAQFTNSATALGHLLFLFCFDEAFGTANLPQVGQIVSEAFSRSLWLLELLGKTADNDGSVVRGMQAMLETVRRASQPLDLNADEFIAVLMRVERDAHKLPQVRGAAAGILWTLGEADNEQILGDLLMFADPNELGDFLTGLFALAREVAQRDSQLVQTIDRLLLEFGPGDFQTALPSLRLAFTYFTPREKHYMLTTLFETLGLKEVKPLTALTVDETTASHALAVEERIFEALAKYGLEAEHD
jgi:hypothetical protein